MKHSTLFSIVGLIILLGLGACSQAEKTEEAKRLPLAEVSVQTIEAQDNTSFFTAVGRVKNVRESIIAGKTMGKVSSVKVKSGDRVSKDQVLIRIDSKGIQGQVSQAKGALAQAKAAKVIAKQMLDRYEELKQTESASQTKYDKATYDYDSAVGAVGQAQGALTTAKSYLKETVIKAPFDGVVVDTMIEVGEMASPGVPLLRMEGESDLEFEATVNGQDIGLIAMDQEVIVELDAANGGLKNLSGHVSEIVPSLDRVTHSNLVRIKLEDDSAVRSGTFGRARFFKRPGSCPGILIPKERIIRHGQLSAVYILDPDQIVRLRLIRAGNIVQDQIEVLSGLEAGDQYISSDLSALIDGQPGKAVQ